MRVDYYPNELGEVSGSCLQGHQEASYDQLVKLFGSPNSDGDGDKVHIEWVINFDILDEDSDDVEAHTATIYDWKEQSPTDAMYGKYNWHIGGRGHHCVELVYEALGK